MAVTANQLIARAEGCKVGMPVAASTRIYQGTLVFAAGGYADDDTASGANRFAGIAIEEKDNSSGSAGDLTVEVWKEGVFELTGSGFAQTSVAKDVYASDNYTLTLTPTASTVRVGTIVEYVSSTRVRVEINPEQPFRLQGFLASIPTVSVAATGSAQGSAAALTNNSNNNVTAGDGTKAVVLPTGIAGDVVIVYHSVATVGLPIFPATGGTINGGSANASITIEGKTQAILVNTDGTNWAATFTVNT